MTNIRLINRIFDVIDEFNALNSEEQLRVRDLVDREINKFISKYTLTYDMYKTVASYCHDNKLLCDRFAFPDEKDPSKLTYVLNMTSIRLEPYNEEEESCNE